MAKSRVMCVVGTRPDAIKSAPVVLELKRFADQCETILVSTGQHREMLDQALTSFGLRADHDLSIMRHGQTLAEVTSRCLEGLDKLLCDVSPDYVIAQGDTTTTFSSSLAAFYRRIPFGHVEAGLRTDSIDNPFPEEFNRRTTGLISTHHFAPTEWSKKNLLNEAKNPESIFVTGNTGIDAVLQIADQAPESIENYGEGRMILLTTHRRENWGEPQRRVAEAAKRILNDFPDTYLVAPMHRNPQVRETLSRVLSEHPRAHLIEPPDYAGFVQLMKRSEIILTDSGGVQEEAPAFGKPILVMRETTERPEGIAAGSAKLVGADEDMIVAETSELLTNRASYDAMAKVASPYGDGKASARIRYVVLKSLGIETPPEPMWS